MNLLVTKMTEAKTNDHFEAGIIFQMNDHRMIRWDFTIFGDL